MNSEYNRIIKYEGSSRFHTNLRKMQAFRKVAFEAWEAKDYDKAIEFINYAIDFCEHDNNRQVLEEWDLVRIYADKTREEAGEENDPHDVRWIKETTGNKY